MRFRYLKDPLFLTCVVIYFVNRWVLKSVWDTGFVHEHLNDLICIPFWVPIMVWLQQRVGLRNSDGPPDASEIVIPLIIWSVLFELVLPSTEIFGSLCTSDYKDVLYYSVGALAAWVVWQCWYGCNSGQPVPSEAELAARETELRICG